jgi:ABC-2 type transport system ATP-binding protein
MANDTNNTVVEVSRLTKHFGRVTAVDDLSFDIQRGEIVGLLGPNGAGKTTTLHMLLDLITPSSGDIKIFGCNIRECRPETLKRLNFSSSYVSLPYSLTVEENLKVFAGIYEIKNAKKKIAEVIDIFDIGDIRREPTRRLSSGQITRVSLAKSLLNDPEVLFLDEPTASLDPEIADKTRKLLKQYTKDRNMGILYTSHNMQEIEDLCDRLIFLSKGRLLATGKPSEIIERFDGNTLEEVFLNIARKEKMGMPGGLQR